MTISPIAEQIVSTPIDSVFIRTIRANVRLSPAEYAVASMGKAASENATPNRLTGTLWKFRARLTEVMLPATRVDATLVKNRNVSGSMGLDAVFGSASRKKSRSPATCSASRARMWNAVPRMPTTRIPRWRPAPITAPIAAPKMPNSGLRTSAPNARPALYRIGARP